MTVHLGKRWQKKLAELPETGMGSQHVDIVLKNGRMLEDLPVFNGEECETNEALNPKDIAEIRLHGSSANGQITHAA